MYEAVPLGLRGANKSVWMAPTKKKKKSIILGTHIKMLTFTAEINMSTVWRQKGFSFGTNFPVHGIWKCHISFVEIILKIQVIQGMNGSCELPAQLHWCETKKIKMQTHKKTCLQHVDTRSWLPKNLHSVLQNLCFQLLKTIFACGQKETHRKKLFLLKYWWTCGPDFSNTLSWWITVITTHWLRSVLQVCQHSQWPRTHGCY